MNTIYNGNFYSGKTVAIPKANAKIKNNIALDTINAIITTPLFNIEFANLRLSAFL